jgi:hypothetical protein
MKFDDDYAVAEPEEGARTTNFARVLQGVHAARLSS